MCFSDAKVMVVRGSTLAANGLERSASRRPLGIAAAGIAFLFCIFEIGLLPSFKQLNHSTLQMIFFPLVLALVWGTRCIPARLIAFSAVAGMLSVWIALHVFSNDRGAVHVARFAGDPYEARSRIFREGLNAKFPWNHFIRTYRYWNVVGSRAEADAVIQSEKDVRILVWGDEKRLRVSFGPARTEALGDLLDEPGNSLIFEFEMYSRVPVVGLAAEPFDAVQEYLAHLFEGLVPLASPQVRISGGVGMRHELDMRAAARLVSAWRTEEHRGFAWWVLGNYYLRKSLLAPSSRRGYLSCATRAYQAAASYVRPGENPELFAAIHNNYAGLLLLRRLTGFGKISLRKVWKSLRYAGTAASYRGAYNAQLESFAPLQSNMKRLTILRKRSENLKRRGAKGGIQKKERAAKTKHKKSGKRGKRQLIAS